MEYCQKDTKTNDPDRYLLSLFAKVENRDALWALCSFNTEIGKTRTVVTETSIGLMRLLWWREGVQEIYHKGNLRDNPVIQSLKIVIERYDLPLSLFEDMTYAREFDLEDVLPGNVDGLKKYCDFIHTPFLKLCAIIVGENINDKEEKENLRLLAINYALIGVLRNLVVHAKDRRIYLPEDMLNKNGVSKTNVYELKKRKEISEIVEILCKDINFNLKFKTPFFKSYNALGALYLKQLKSLKYDVMDYRLTLPPVLKELRVWKAATF